MKELKISSLLDLPEVAKSVLDFVAHHKIVAFYAKMGAGKTTLIQEILKEMGVRKPDGSPTYSLVNTYDTARYGEVFHFDVYRLNSLQDAVEAGIEEMFYSGAICFIEWAEQIEDLLPDNFVRVEIEVNSNTERIIRIIEVNNRKG